MYTNNTLNNTGPLTHASVVVFIWMYYLYTCHTNMKYLKACHLLLWLLSCQYSLGDSRDNVLYARQSDCQAFHFPTKLAFYTWEETAHQQIQCRSSDWHIEASQEKLLIFHQARRASGDGNIILWRSSTSYFASFSGTVVEAPRSQSQTGIYKATQGHRSN